MRASQLGFDFSELRLPWLPAPEPVGQGWQGPPCPESLTDADNDRLVLEYEACTGAEVGLDVEESRQLYLHCHPPHPEIVAFQIAWALASREAWPGLVAAVARFLPQGPHTVG